MRNLPQLTGVTQAVLPVNGTVYLNAQVGTQVVRHLFTVVPDELLDTDVLLGADLLGTAPLSWDQAKGKITWGDCTYPVRLLKQRPSTKRVRMISRVQIEEPNSTLRLKNKLVLPPSSAGIYAVPINESPGTLLEYQSVLRMRGVGTALCLQVSGERQVSLPLVNNTRSRIILKMGTLVGTYVKIKSEDLSTPAPSCRQVRIKNDLIPEGVEVVSGQGSREEKLEKLIVQQDFTHLTEEQREALKRVLIENNQVFILDKEELGKFKGVKGHIQLSDPTPTRSPLYRYPERAKELIANMLTEMEEKDIIEQSSAAWLSPIVLVRKPDNSQRMCLDYRKVNTHLQTDIHPLPRLEELVESASGNEYYASLDMKDAYYQVELDEESRDLTTFSDGISLYRFKRLPFGLSCSPAIFTRVIGNVLAPLVKKGWVKNYLDDVVVWAPTFALLTQRLEELFKLFIEQGVKLNVKKCQFGQPEIKFLGSIISKEGCRPCPDNVSAIREMKAPKNVKETRRFLGMVGFYRKHIKDFAKIAVPLTNLLRDTEVFHWSAKCQDSFDELKERLVTSPVLIKAQMTKPFHLYTDASLDHIGGVLMQESDGKMKAVGYFSKKLKPVEQRYSTTDREALAVIQTCRRFHHFLWGVPFTVHTDHQPLVSVFKKKTKSPRMNRWILEMREYRFKVVYQPGRSNYVADQLSRPVRAVFHNNVDNYLGLSKEEFKEKQLGENRWAELIAYLEGGGIPRKKLPRAQIHQFMMYEGLLYLSADKHDNSIQMKLVVPQELRKKALQFGHENLSGHLGRKKTIDSLEMYFYWPSLRSDVQTFVKECITCQVHKDGPTLQHPFQPLPPVHKPLERISIDLTDMMSGSNGYRYVLTVIDHYSRFVKFYPLRTKTTDEVSKHFKIYLNDFGVPKSVILDNGGEFTSQQFKELCQTHNINTGYTTPYHPEGNSVTERMHRTLKTVLSIMCQGHPYQWPKYLSETQRVLNCAVHSTTGEQPHYSFFSRRPYRQILSDLPTIDEDVGDEDLRRAHEIVQQTHDTMARKYLLVANRKKTHDKVDVGTLVWVRRETQPPGVARKLVARWLGPYRVIQVLRGGATYTVENPFDGSVLERAADKLKRFRGEESYLTRPSEYSEKVPDVDLGRRGTRNRAPPTRLIEEM